MKTSSVSKYAAWDRWATYERTESSEGERDAQGDRQVEVRHPGRRRPPRGAEEDGPADRHGKRPERKIQGREEFEEGPRSRPA